MLANPPAAYSLADEQALGDFAQVLTHRIRNLLAGIEGFTDLLADTLGSQEQRELALRILESTARIEFVLNDLQYYSQPVRMVKIPVYAQDVLDRLLATLSDDDLHRVTLSVAPLDRPLLADPGLLQQALLTLVQNAFDAISKDDRVTIRVAFDDAAPSIRFNVWNPGTIDFEQAPSKVFEPFFTTKVNNLGIGLPLARRIAEAHGGSLCLAANDPIQGTCFTLTVPVSEEDGVFTCCEE